MDCNISVAGLVEVSTEIKEATSEVAKKNKPSEYSVDRKVPTECSICLDRIPKVRGTLACTHGFCYTCISQWSKSENSCPLCKSRFTYILKENSSTNKEGKKVKIKKRSQSFEFGGGMPHIRRAMHQNPLDFLRMMFDPFAHVDMGVFDDDDEEDHVPLFLRYSRHNNRPIDLTGDNDSPRSTVQGLSGPARSSHGTSTSTSATLPRSPFGVADTRHSNESFASGASHSNNSEVIDLTKSSDDERDCSTGNDYFHTRQSLTATSTSTPAEAVPRCSGDSSRIANPRPFAATNVNSCNSVSHSHSSLSGPLPAQGGDLFYFGSATIASRDFVGISSGPDPLNRSVTALSSGFPGGSGSRPSSASDQSLFSQLMGNLDFDLGASGTNVPSLDRARTESGSSGTRRRRIAVRRMPISASTGTDSAIAELVNTSRVDSVSPPRSVAANYLLRERSRHKVSEAVTNSPIASPYPVAGIKAAPLGSSASTSVNISGNTRAASSAVYVEGEANNSVPQRRRTTVKKPRIV